MLHYLVFSHNSVAGIIWVWNIQETIILPAVTCSTVCWLKSCCGVRLFKQVAQVYQTTLCGFCFKLCKSHMDVRASFKSWNELQMLETNKKLSGFVRGQISKQFMLHTVYKLMFLLDATIALVKYMHSALSVLPLISLSKLHKLTFHFIICSLMLSVKSAQSHG